MPRTRGSTVTPTGGAPVVTGAAQAELRLSLVILAGGVTREVPVCVLITRVARWGKPSHACAARLGEFLADRGLNWDEHGQLDLPQPGCLIAERRSNKKQQ